MRDELAVDRSTRNIDEHAKRSCLDKAQASMCSGESKEIP